MLAKPDPLVDLRAFRNVNFAFGSLFSIIIGIGLYGSVYVIPLFLGRVRNYDSLMIGETMFVTGLTMLFAAPIAGRLSKAVDLRVMLAFGLGTVPLLWVAQTQFGRLQSRMSPLWSGRVRVGLSLAAALIAAWRLRGTLGAGGPDPTCVLCF